MFTPRNNKLDHAWPCCLAGGTALLLLLFCLIPDRALAQLAPSATPQKDFNFSAPDPAPLTLNWSMLSTVPAQLSITNDTPKEIKPRVEVSKLKPIGSNAEPIDISRYLIIEPEKPVLPAAGILYIKIGARPKAEEEIGPLKSGIYTGYIVVIDDSTGTFIRKQIQLGVPVVPVSVPVNVQAAVDKMTVRVWRSWPAFISSSLCKGGKFTIPLTAKIDPSVAFTADAPIGFLTREAGGTATLWIDKTGADAQKATPTPSSTPSPTSSPVASTTPSAEMPSLAVVIKDVKHAGKYDGQIILDPKSPTTKLALTVYATDIFVWPVLALAAGILLALFTRRYINVSRNIWIFRRQEAELGLQFIEAQRHFIRNSQGQPFASYTVAKDFAERRRRLAARIEELYRSSIINLSDVPSATFPTTVADEFKFLSAKIVDWSALSTELLALQQELESAYPKVVKITATDGESPGHNFIEGPAFLNEHYRYLVGEEKKLEELSELRENVKKGTLFARLWGALDKRFEGCLAIIGKLEKDLESRKDNPSEDDIQLAAKLNEVKAILNSVQIELWTVKSEKGLVDFQTAEDLDEVESTLLLLNRDTFTAKNFGLIFASEADKTVGLTNKAMLANAEKAFNGISQPRKDADLLRDNEPEGIKIEAQPQVVTLEDRVEEVEGAKEGAPRQRKIPEAGKANALTKLLTKMRNFAAGFTSLRRSKNADKKRAEKYRTAVFEGDLLIVLFSFTVALLTGLNNYYIGKPFGTMGDYLTLLIWGFGTQAVLDMVIAAVDRFLPGLSLTQSLLKR